MILKSRKLKYQAAEDRILNAILSGNLASNNILPSEQQLASQLNISRNTVRTALHELEIKGIITKQNGRPSQVNAEMLRKKNDPLRHIAWVDTAHINYTNPIYFDIFRSVSENAAMRNVKLDYISLSIEPMLENFFLRQHEYDGLILGEFTGEYFKYLSEITHPNTVCVDAPKDNICHCIKTDCCAGGQIAAQKLLDTNHKTPILLGVEAAIKSYLPFQERLCGFTETFANANLPLTSDRILISEKVEDIHCLSDFLRKHLETLKTADSIFVVADYLAMQTMYSLIKIGLRVPEDISIIGFDGLTMSKFVSPALTTIRQPVEKIGEKALEIILNPDAKELYPKNIQITPTFVTGATLQNR